MDDEEKWDRCYNVTQKVVGNRPLLCKVYATWVSHCKTCPWYNSHILEYEDELNGFVTKQPYCPKFNESLRKQIREKYNNKCFICSKPESENLTKTGKQRKLSVHHIDMNKNQGCNSEWELIPICMDCHGRVHNNLWKYRLEYILDSEI